jgi:hypothetical protein
MTAPPMRLLPNLPDTPAGSRRRVGYGLTTVPAVSRVVETDKARLVWSADGKTVVTTLRAQPSALWALEGDALLGSAAAASRNEIRVNRLLSSEPPPVAFPRPVASSSRSLSLTVEAIQGDPLGPKFPLALPRQDLEGLIDLVDALGSYAPQRPWFRRLDVSGRLRGHVDEGLLTRRDADAVEAFARTGIGWQFAHGDVTARNVLRGEDGRLVLIDWEWAGLYPVGYEQAFLWVTLIDVAGGRQAVTDGLPRQVARGFVLSALLVELLHLHLWLRGPRHEFVANHERTLGDLLVRIR